MAGYKEKVGVVTGAGSGIGRATAIEFARQGALVIAADVNARGCEETLARIKDFGGTGVFVKTDVAEPRDIQNLIQETVHRFGRLDFAFNNAGIEGESSSTADCTLENWERVITINLRGVWLCMKYEIPEMLKSGSGAIVNCSSVAGLVGFTGIPAYTASKHGVIGLTRTAALEYAKKGLRVNAVCPGVIATPMVDRFTHGEAQALQVLSAGEPVGRLGQPEEVAAAVVWLCSEQASFVTGQALGVDGGWVAQ